ncbi:MAG: cupin domain-containing protein [Bryobacterales bacterium]|nr:cupin domain-containing protein [Bryobacterales bacterium]
MSQPQSVENPLLSFDEPLSEAELLAFEETAARLAFAAPLEKPCGGLRAKLLRQIQEPAQASVPHKLLNGFTEPVTGFHLLKSGEGKWRQHDAAGIQYKVLSYDPASDAVTSLVRMEPGAKYPRHRHSKEEQCWVLEGDVRQVDHSISMRAGDFFRAMPGTDHDSITTDEGCLLIIIGAAHDERL